MNLKDLHDKLENMLLNDVDAADVKVLVHIGGGELATIDSVRLDIVDADGEDGDTWNWEDGVPKLGIHFDSPDQLAIVIDAEE